MLCEFKLFEQVQVVQLFFFFTMQRRMKSNETW
jgi:hypothetical protein